MDGILYTIDKLGQSLAVTESQLAEARSENEALRSQLASLNDDSSITE